MNVLDVAKWFIDKHEDISSKSFNGNVKLQKLLYYTQVISIAHTGESIFDEDVEAWKHGPVISMAYQNYEYNFNELKNRIVAKISDSNNFLLNVVNSIYGFKTAKELEDISHSEMPWLELKDKVDQRLNPIITEERIKEYYVNMKDVFDGFNDFDFDNETAEYINSNVFVYNSKNTTLTEEDKSCLYDYCENVENSSFYVYKEDGELVVY